MKLPEGVKPKGIEKIGNGEYQTYSYPFELARKWMGGELSNDDLPREMRFTRIKGETYLISPVVKSDFDIVEHKARKDDADVFGDTKVYGINEIIEETDLSKKGGEKIEQSN